MRKSIVRAGICVLILGGFVYGMISAEYEIFPYRQIRSICRRLSAEKKAAAEPKNEQGYSGRWNLFRRGTGGEEPSAGNPENSLSTLPYLQGYHPSRSRLSGVVFHDEKHASNGVTLFCSGHAPVVFLMDMKGEILHIWSIQFEKIWPDSLPFFVNEEHKEFIRRAYLYPNGDILCLFEYAGLVKLDKDSRILWQFATRNHHDLQVDQNGDIYTLARNVRKIKAEYPQAPFAGDYIYDDELVVLTADGKEIRRISVFDAFYQSEYAGYLNSTRSESAIDIFHTNSIQCIRNPARRVSGLFRDGDMLISIRNIDTIAVIDGVTAGVKWAVTGKWHAQHQAVLLGNGNILLLDNQGANPREYFRSNRSKIIEFDPLTQRTAWEYSKDGKDEESFFTHWLGYNQRLANGNTLITESDQGHILEVTPGKKIVWEYYSSHRVGKDKEFIATIMGAMRIDPAKLSFLHMR